MTLGRQVRIDRAAETTGGTGRGFPMTEEIEVETHSGIPSWSGILRRGGDLIGFKTEGDALESKIQLKRMGVVPTSQGVIRFSRSAMKFKDYYEVLGIPRDASADQIKKAYRKLAHQYHPDISKDPQGEEKFKEVNEAYKTLKDPELRKAYDGLGRHDSGESFRPPPDWGSHFRQSGQGGFDPSDFEMHGGFEGVDLGDLFEHLSRARGGSGGFSSHGRGTHAQGQPLPVRGQDFEVGAEIRFLDAFEGTILEMALDMPEYDPEGRIHRVPQNFKARIPKGVTDGQRMRLAGKGGKGLNGGPNGDLYITLRLKPDPVFRSSGHDLYMDLPVSPWEAALGAQIEVPQVDGGSLSVKVPGGISSGRKMRLAGKGLPKPKEGRGDLYIIIHVITPTHLEGDERRLFEELARVSKFNPRAHLGPQASGHSA